MSRETKILNIKRQIDNNERKIGKLEFINSNLRLQLQQLEMNRYNNTYPPTREEREEQSRKDKEKFQTSLEDFVKKLEAEKARITPKI